jgi:hypothetical protein
LLAELDSRRRPALRTHYPFAPRRDESVRGAA